MHDMMPLPRPENPHANRHILLLQSMQGPFFRRIATALRGQGFGVSKVNFNGGDRLFWTGCGGGIDYTGQPAAWPDFLTRIIFRKNITDVALFGDCRPMHRAAIAVCQDLQIAVHVFDEGYIRPDWITFELGGVNGHSLLPRDPDYYLAQARHLAPLPPLPPLPSSFGRRARNAILYETANYLLHWRFPHWKTHRPWGAIREGIGWLRRLSNMPAAAAESAAIMAGLEAGATPYMLFPLQLDSDAQIRFHSPFPSMQAALAAVLQSFAAHAAPPLRLVIKEHPLDNGLTDWRARVTTMATQLGVAERVDYLSSGDIALIVRAARGLVTINSTTGTLALAGAIPVITLGQAVYDMPGITHQDGLARFWHAPQPPDLEIFAAFRRVLIERCLISGGFFSDPALERTVQGVVQRFTSSRQVKPSYVFTRANFIPRPHVPAEPPAPAGLNAALAPPQLTSPVS